MDETTIIGHVANGNAWWEWRGRFWSLARVTPGSLASLGRDSCSEFHLRFMMVRPVNVSNDYDYALYGRRDCPLTWARALWWRKLRWPVLRACYWVMRDLRRLGLAWWPEDVLPPFEIAAVPQRSESEFLLLYGDRPPKPTLEQVDAVLKALMEQKS